MENKIIEGRIDILKKILYITSNDINYTNGGAIGTKKFLKFFEKIDKSLAYKVYIYMSTEKKVNFKNEFCITKKRKKYKGILSRILGFGDQLELYKRDILKKIEKEKIDIVILQSSRLGNLSEAIRNKFKDIKIIQNFDNFEYEFSKMYTRKMLKIIQCIELKNIKSTEKKALTNSDCNIFLTKKDKDNIESFYRIKRGKNMIIPLIYPSKNLKDNIAKQKGVAIFTGSLDMESNIEAAIFLIDNIKDILKMTKIKKIILAGRNPSKEIIKKIEKIQEIILYENPESEIMASLLQESELYISPVFTGSGMKTKFLEAIAHGLPIVASEHTLIGYDWFNLKKYKFIKEFKDFSLEDLILNINIIEKEKIEKTEILEFYNKNFNEEGVIKKIESIILEISK